MWSYFFDPATESYPEFSQSVPIIVFSMFVGVALAAAISLYYKKVLGSFVAFQLKSGADSEATAIRLSETSYAKNPFVRSAIRGGSVYRSVLRSVAPDGASPGKRLKEKNAFVLQSSYYIPEELSFRAENLFLKRGTTLLSAIIGILLCLIIGALSLVVIPDLLQMLQNLIASMS